jgi:hypothetical protein
MLAKTFFRRRLFVRIARILYVKKKVFAIMVRERQGAEDNSKKRRARGRGSLMGVLSVK